MDVHEDLSWLYPSHHGSQQSPCVLFSHVALFWFWSPSPPPRHWSVTHCIVLVPVYFVVSMYLCDVSFIVIYCLVFLFSSSSLLGPVPVVITSLTRLLTSDYDSWTRSNETDAEFTHSPPALSNHMSQDVSPTLKCL